jgi:hypothetical protein
MRWLIVELLVNSPQSGVLIESNLFFLDTALLCRFTYFFYTFIRVLEIFSVLNSEQYRENTK